MEGLLPLAEPSLDVAEAEELDAVSLEPLASVAGLASLASLELDEDEPSAEPSPPEDLRA